jgi:sugar transferase (PEP-CTERM/EpsH1 system associated)
MKDLLFLAHRIPYPPNKGDKIRSFHIIRYLARHYRIHLAAFVDDPRDMRYVCDVEAMCASTCLLPLSPTLARLKSLRGLLCGSALSLPYFHDRRMQRWIETVIQSNSVLRVFMYSSPMAQYVMDRDPCSMRRVIDFVDVDSEKWRQYAKQKPWPLSWLYRREGKLLARFEQDVASGFDASILVSAEEAGILKQLAPNATRRIGYIDNGVDHQYFTPDCSYVNPYADEDDVLVFTGAMDYWANVDAVRWFAMEVFPQVRRVVPTARFAIVGARPRREVLRLGSLPGVLVTGAVADIRPYLAHARAAVAPMNIARGVQNKVLEAMAMATPVIATSVALAGIAIDEGVAVQLADDKVRFADLCVQLLQTTDSPAVIKSRQWVCQRYDWERNLEGLQDLFDGRGCPENGLVLAFAAG